MSFKNQLVKISDAAISIKQFAENLPEGIIKSKEDLLEIGNLGAILFSLSNENKKIDNQNLIITGQLKKMAYQFQLSQTILENIFSERRELMKKHFEVIDHAIKTNDNSLILSSLKSISETIASSPFESYEKFKSIIDNDDEILRLDF
jgi:hypothetical protein